jgi:hypothetical protein
LKTPWLNVVTLKIWTGSVRSIEDAAVHWNETLPPTNACIYQTRWFQKLFPMMRACHGCSRWWSTHAAPRCQGCNLLNLKNVLRKVHNWQGTNM